MRGNLAGGVDGRPVTTLTTSLLIDAPLGSVRRVLGRTDVWTRTARAAGARAEVAGQRVGGLAPLRDGDLIRVRADRAHQVRWLPSRSLILRVRTDPAGLPSLHLVAGPVTELVVELTAEPADGGTLGTVTVRAVQSPGSLAGVLTPLLRRRLFAAGRLLLGIALLAAREPLIVVGGCVIADGAVLAARRTTPPDLAGKWELPGGKVDPGETERAALVRELAEELGVTVAVGDRVGPDVDLGDNVLLRCYRCEIVAGSPVPTEHEAVRWVRAGDLDALDWLAGDAQVIGHVRGTLNRRGVIPPDDQ